MAPQPVSPGTRTQHLYPFGKTASAPAWQVCVRGCVCVGACLCVCVREHVYVICVGVAFHLLCAHDLCARTHTRHHTHNESHKYAENMTNRHVEQVGGFQITQKRPWGSPDMCGAHARVERGTDRYRDGSPPSDSHVRPQTRRAVSAVSASSPPEQGSVWSVLGSRSQPSPRGEGEREAAGAGGDWGGRGRSRPRPMPRVVERFESKSGVGGGGRGGRGRALSAPGLQERSLPPPSTRAAGLVRAGDPACDGMMQGAQAGILKCLFPLSFLLLLFPLSEFLALGCRADAVHVQCSRWHAVQCRRCPMYGGMHAA